MHKDDYYRRLANANLLIMRARERIDEQKARVLELNGHPECGQAVKILRSLDRSLKRMLRARAIIIRQLMTWPTSDALPSLGNIHAIPRAPMRGQLASPAGERF